jgi:hypothetical protein
MRPRHVLAAFAGPALLAVLVIAGPAVQRTDAASLYGRVTRDTAAAMVDGIAQATLDAPTPPQRISAHRALAAYVAVTASVALVFVFWTADGVSSWSLITGAGLARRRRAPPLVRA